MKRNDRYSWKQNPVIENIAINTQDKETENCMLIIACHHY